MERSIWLLYVYNRHLYPGVSQLVDVVIWGHEAGGSSPLTWASEAVDNRVVRLPKSTHPRGAGKIIAPYMGD